MEQIFDALSHAIWKTSYDDRTWLMLTQRSSALSVQVAVFQVLQSTARSLAASPAITTHAKSRLSKWLQSVYGQSPDNSKVEDRWARLRELDCATFLFIALSYTPLEITKMHDTEFRYLQANASKYMCNQRLPPRWIFQKGIQMELAANSDHIRTTPFRKGLFNLRFLQ